MPTVANPGGSKIEPGIRGWLLLLVLWLAIFDPVYSLVLNGFFAWHGSGSLLDIAAYVGIRAAMRIAAATALYVSRKPAAVWFVLAMVWLSGPVYVIASWALLDNQVMPWAPIRSFAIAAAVTLYLFRSERVRATYGFGTQQ